MPPAQFRAEGRRRLGGGQVPLRELRALHGLRHGPHQDRHSGHPWSQEETEDEIKEGGQDAAKAEYPGG